MNWKHERIAALLNYSPNHPESWPLELIERLLEIEEKKGKRVLFEEINKLKGS